MDQRRNRRPLVALLLALAAGCATTGGDAAGGGGSANQVGAPLPPLKVETLGGKQIDVASYRGRVLLLDVWASWCGPCKQELPMLDAMAKRLKGQGVEILAVSVDQERANVEKFMHGRGRWELTVAHDPAGVIADRLQPDKMPTSYIVDRSGIVRYVNAGFVPDDAPGIERRLREVAGR
jgi:cytochrome c biogenesis protein CcmG/thiol:disulfide interchange protein DsbE